ncbi:MAG: hypothetical protein J0L57_00890 [Burkholderiales bacterium]|nr:hypothetical protein [Burkholderiales bacterium]
MRKPAPTKKIKTETPPQKKPVKTGPVELSPADMKKVSGGLPRGTWSSKDPK